MFILLEKLHELLGWLRHGLAKIVALLMWPFDVTFRSIAWVVFEGTDHFQEWMGTLVWLLTWPFRAIVGGLMAVAGWLSSPWSRLSASFLIDGPRRLLLQIGFGFFYITEAVHLDRPIWWLIWLTQQRFPASPP